MRHVLLSSLVLAAFVLPSALHAASPGSVSAGGVTLASTHIELPFGTTLYTGAGADVMNANCLGCHSTEMVSTQPNLPEATWKAEIGKMRAAFKAPIADADIPAILAYLMQAKGAK